MIKWIDEYNLNGLIIVSAACPNLLYDPKIQLVDNYTHIWVLILVYIFMRYVDAKVEKKTNRKRFIEK